MTARSSVHVYVTSKDRANSAWLAPGDEVPGWARLDERNLQPGSSQSPTPDPQAPDPVPAPPRAGRGSGLEAWLRFAEAHGVGVDSDMSRDDVIAACEAAGVTTPEG